MFHQLLLSTLEGEAESASLLVVEERHFYISTRLVAAETSLTNTSRLEQTCPQVCGGWPEPGRPGGSREPFEQRFPGRPKASRAVKLTKMAGVDSQLVSRSFLPYSLPHLLPFTLYIEYLLGARPGPLQKLGLLSRTVLISPSHQV